MSALTDRRSTLLVQAANRARPIYCLENRSVSVGDRIITDLYPFQPDFSTTILLDITTTANPTSNGSSIWKLINVHNTEKGRPILRIGKTSKWITDQRMFWCSWTVFTLTGSKSAPGRHKYAVTHNANTKDLYVGYRYNNEARLEFQLIETFTPSSEDSLSFGYTGEETLPPGTIHSARVYDKVLSQNELNEFFS